MRGEDKAGLYITVIFHLVIIIVLLACQIGAAMKGENTFVLDFTKQEEVEKKKAEENFKEEVSDRLDQLLASASGVPIRNIAVDRSSTLKDDRNTNAEQLYKDVAELVRKRGVAKLIGIGSELCRNEKIFDLPEKYFFQTTDEFIGSDVFRKLGHEIVLLKGARQFGFEKITDLLVEKVHETTLDFDRAQRGRIMTKFRLKE